MRSTYPTGKWYYLRGQARMTVFNTGPKATTTDIRPGDVGVVRKSLGHYVENTGSDVLQFLEVFALAESKRSHLPNGSATSHLSCSCSTSISPWRTSRSFRRMVAASFPCDPGAPSSVARFVPMAASSR